MAMDPKQQSQLMWVDWTLQGLRIGTRSPDNVNVLFGPAGCMSVVIDFTTLSGGSRERKIRCPVILYPPI